jgi:hypothetical protein
MTVTTMHAAMNTTCIPRWSRHRCCCCCYCHQSFTICCYPSAQIISATRSYNKPLMFELLIITPAVSRRAHRTWIENATSHPHDARDFTALELHFSFYIRLIDWLIALDWLIRKKTILNSSRGSTFSGLTLSKEMEDGPTAPHRTLCLCSSHHAWSITNAHLASTSTLGRLLRSSYFEKFGRSSILCDACQHCNGNSKKLPAFQNWTWAFYPHTKHPDAFSELVIYYHSESASANDDRKREVVEYHFGCLGTPRSIYIDIIWLWVRKSSTDCWREARPDLSSINT